MAYLKLWGIHQAHHFAHSWIERGTEISFFFFFLIKLQSKSVENQDNELLGDIFNVCLNWEHMQTLILVKHHIQRGMVFTSTVFTHWSIGSIN